MYNIYTKYIISSLCCNRNKFYDMQATFFVNFFTCSKLSLNLQYINKYTYKSTLVFKQIKTKKK